MLNGFVGGDASGGNRSVQIDFRAGGLPPNGLLWSLEELVARDSQNTGKSGFVEAFNTDEDSGTGVSSRWGFIFTLEALGPSTLARMLPEDLTYLKSGQFLGRQDSSLVASGVIVTLANVDGASLSVSAGGYVWDRIANSVRGGPLRPLEGLYAR